MNSTDLSLLDHLRSPLGENGDAWKKFVDLYTPLLLHWSRRLDVPASEQVDLVQDTLAKLLVSIRKYQKEEQSSFRGWLFTVHRNTWLDTRRKFMGRQTNQLTELEVPPLEDPAQRWTHEEYNQYVMRRVHRLVLADFPPISHRAFQLNVIEGLPAQQVGEQLGLSANAVYLIRSRILRRIRSELQGLLD